MTNTNYYVLNNNIGLRSWMKLPYAYCIKDQYQVGYLKEEDFFLLSKCDGKHLLEDSKELESLVLREIIHISDGQEELDEWQKLKLYKNRCVLYMNLEVTGKCNCNCLHCFNASDNSPLMSELSYEACEEILDQAQNCGVMSFTVTGGEPMIHPHFMDIMHGIYQRGMRVIELNTNGTKITEEILLEMKSFGCMPRMKLSFDGIGYHDLIRGKKGTEEETLHAMKLCIKHGFDVQAQVNINRINLSSIENTLEVLDELGVKYTRLIRTTESPRWIENSKKLCKEGGTLEYAEFYDAVLGLLDNYTKKEHHMEIDAWQFARVYPKDKRYSPEASNTVKLKYRDSLPVCLSNRRMVGVTSTGELIPCLQMSGYYQKYGISLGNILKDDLSELLSEGDYIQEVHQTLKDLKENNKTCAVCKYFENCRGGCRAIARGYTGYKLGIDPSKCVYYQNDYTNQIETVLQHNGYTKV